MAPLSNEQTHELRHLYVPIINIPRRDFAMRTESVWLFQRAHIDVEKLTFIDEIDLDGLLASGRLKLVLMDHNKLCQRQTQYAGVVEEVVDHHHNENLYLASVQRRVVEPVGSACTLVAEEVLHSKEKGKNEPFSLSLSLSLVHCMRARGIQE